MKIVIAGAGAIGGYIGARLARAAIPGVEVVLFARGPHLRAMQERGLRVTSPDGDFEVRPTVTGQLSTIGPADVVFLGVKAHGLTALAPELEPLLGPDTTVVSTQNGIPWWYFQGIGGDLEGFRLERVDPGGVIADAIQPRRVVGSLAYFATDVIEPGVIRHTEGNKISFGEPDGRKSERLRTIAEPLIAAGFRCPINARFRHEIWVKLLGNVAFNPISALTGGTLEELVRHRDTSLTVREIMAETEAVAAKLGIELPISIDQRMAGAEKVGAHKTSMLQDLEAGRPMELEAVVGAVVELGEKLGVPMPTTRAVYACAKMLDEKRSAERAARWRGEGSPPLIKTGGSIGEHQQPLVSALRFADRDDHDRQPPVLLDVVRRADANGDEVEVVRHPVGVHALHPVPDLGATGAGISHRSSRTSPLYDGRRRSVRNRLDRPRHGDDAADGLHAVCHRRHRRGADLRRQHGFGVEVVHEGPRIRGRRDRRRIRGRHGAVHPDHRLDHQDARVRSGVYLHRHFSGRRDPHRGAVPPSSKGGACGRQTCRRIGDRPASLHAWRDAAHPAIFRALCQLRDDGHRRPAGDRQRRFDGEVVGHPRHSAGRGDLFERAREWRQPHFLGLDVRPDRPRAGDGYCVLAAGGVSGARSDGRPVVGHALYDHTRLDVLYVGRDLLALSVDRRGLLRHEVRNRQLRRDVLGEGRGLDHRRRAGGVALRALRHVDRLLLWKRRSCRPRRRSDLRLAGDRRRVEGAATRPGDDNNSK